jgi:hypothetical protein
MNSRLKREKKRKDREITIAKKPWKTSRKPEASLGKEVSEPDLKLRIRLADLIMSSS